MSRNRLIYNAPYIIIASIFGPYLTRDLGIRLEQLVIYPLALLLLFSRPAYVLKPSLWIWQSALLWIGIFALAIVNSTIVRPVPSLGILLAGIDNHLLPLALMMVVAIFAKEAKRCKWNVDEYLIKLFRLFALLLCINSAIALLQQLVPGFSAHLSMFWSSDTSGPSVGLQAVDMGRLVGIFNQPAENGIAYGLGILGLLYIDVFRKIRKSDYLLLIGILIGGILAVSKVFYLGVTFVATLFLIYVKVLKNRRSHIMKNVAVLSVIFGFSALIFLMLLDRWEWAQHYKRTIESGNVIFSLTGGRAGLGTEEFIISKIKEIWATNYLTGIGFGYFQVTDIGLLYVFMISGLVGLILYILLFLVLASRGLLNIGKVYACDLRAWFYTLIFFCVGCDMGFPALIANRSSTLLWLFVMMAGQLLFGRNEPEYL